MNRFKKRQMNAFKKRQIIQMTMLICAICLIPTLFGILRLLHECKPEDHTCKPMPVAERQRWLRDAGYYEGKIDGLCWTLTHDAQLAWEKQDITDSANDWYVFFGGTEEKRLDK